MDPNLDALRDRGIGNRRNRAVGDGGLRRHFDGRVGMRWSEELAGDESDADNGADRKQHHDHPPEEKPTRHGSDPSRRSPPELYYLDPADFAALWVSVEPRLFRRLMRDGFDTETARDLCQDVAGALLANPPKVQTREELARLALLVGHRLSEKLRRREARMQLGDIPDVAAPDVADVVERQHVVRAVVLAVEGLSDRDRRAVLESPSPALTPTERNRLYVRLHRARQRLQKRLKGWMIGVYVGRHLPRRDGVLADGAVRAVCLSAAVVFVTSTSLLQGGTNQPAAAAGGDNRVIASSVSEGDSGTERPLASVTSVPHPPSAPIVQAAPALGTRSRPTQSVVISAPLGTHAGAGTRERPPGNDALTCLSGLRVAPDFCVQHPLRKDGGSLLPHP